MKEYLIVDGYNIINAWDELKKVAQENLEVAREKLIDLMMEYGAFRGLEIIIVFDAYMVKGNREKIVKNNNLSIVFTKENMTADSYIEKFISTLSKYDLVRVATNDWAEQQIVLGKGRNRISARELKIEVENSKTKIKNTHQIKTSQKNTVESILDEITLSKLQKIRRKH